MCSSDLEMRGVAIQGDVLVIGSATTHAEIAADATVKKLFPSLASGCLSVGSPQIRNIATLAGNIVSAQPAADSVVPMTALGASCEILSEDGRTVKPLSALSKAVGESHVDPTKEILTKIYIDIPKCRYGTSFKRIAPREAMALPVVNVAVMLKAEGAQIAEARIVVSPVAVVPFRAKETEAFLHGKVPSEELLKQAAEIVGNEVTSFDLTAIRTNLPSSFFTLCIRVRLPSLGSSPAWRPFCAGERSGGGDGLARAAAP